MRHDRNYPDVDRARRHSSSPEVRGYIRVSSEQQSDKGLLVEGHRHAVERYRRESGLGLSRTYTATGKRQQRRETVRSRRETGKRLAQPLHLAEKGESGVSPRTTLAEFPERWLVTLLSEGKATALMPPP